jgi:poly[(R)-3-hydroxyalkanoate] polymerase subunit PhaE
VTPFDYMKTMAELWGRGGKDFAVAQQSFLAGMTKATGGTLSSGASSIDAFNTQGLVKANEALSNLLSSALEVSQTITGKMQAGGNREPAVEELLSKIFDPRAWFSGVDGIDQALQRMAEGPRFADLWDSERKMLALFNAWTALRQRSLEHNTVLLEAWISAATKFAKDLNEKADRKEALGSWRDVLALWVETANTALLETQRSEPFFKSQREVLKASTDLRLAQQEMAAFYSEIFGYPTREELDDVHRSVTELRRELRALQRVKRGQKKKPRQQNSVTPSVRQRDPKRSAS